MGLSNFPSAADGVLTLLIMQAVLSVALLKNMVRSVLQVMGVTWIDTDSDLEEDPEENFAGERRILITHFKFSTRGGVDCCVCLCGFEANEEVSELACKHFFHKGCLEKWFNNNHSTCPLCRSTL